MKTSTWRLLSFCCGAIDFLGIKLESSADFDLFLRYVFKFNCHILAPKSPNHLNCEKL